MLRDSRETAQRISSNVVTPLDDPKVQAAADLASFGARVAGEAANSLQRASELDEDDKAQLAAIQSADAVYKENEVSELQSGLDGITGKQANREKYTKQLAARNAASRFNNELTTKLPDYNSYDASDFTRIATDEFKEHAKGIYGADTEGYTNAVNEFSRQLPKVSAVQAQHYASYSQAQVVRENVDVYTNEWEQINGVIGGVASPSTKMAASLSRNNFFSDDHNVGGQAPNVVRNHKAIAINQSLKLGNTGMYMAAKSNGFLAKLPVDVQDTLNKSMIQSIERREVSVGLTIDKRINNATENSDLAELATGRAELADWLDSGFYTEQEQLQYEHQRSRLIRAEHALIPKTTARDKVTIRGREALDDYGHIERYSGNEYTTAENKVAVSTFISQIATDGTGAEIPTDGEAIPEEVALQMVLADTGMFNEVMKRADFFGTPSAKLETVVQETARQLPNYIDEYGQMDGKKQEQMNTINSWASAYPSKFAKLFGEDALVNIELYNYHRGKSGQAFATAMNQYQQTKSVPVTLDTLGIDTKATKREYVLSRLGMEGADLASADYLVKKFDTGARIYGSADGGARYAQFFSDNIDDDYSGTIIKGGKLYADEHLGGKSVSDALKLLEVQIDTNGDTFLTEVLQSRLPQGSTAQTFNDLQNLIVETNPITGVVVISSATMSSPIVMHADNMNALVGEATRRQELYQQFENDLAARKRNMSMYFYSTQPDDVTPLDIGTGSGYPLNSKDTTKKKASWDKYVAEAGRDAETNLAEYGIIPPDEVLLPDNSVQYGDIYIPVGGFTEVGSGEAAVPGLIEADQPGYVPVEVDAYSRPVIDDVERQQLTANAKKKYAVTSEEEAELVSISGEALELLRHEGLEHTVYEDTKGNPTWGVGFKLEEANMATGKWQVGATTVNREYIMEEYKRQLVRATGTAKKYLARSGVNDASSEMVNIVTNMAYNHGESGLDEYVELSKALNRGNASAVLQEMRNSKWWQSYADKSLDRANELVVRMQNEMMRQGNWIWETQ